MKPGDNLGPSARDLAGIQPPLPSPAEPPPKSSSVARQPPPRVTPPGGSPEPRRAPPPQARPPVPGAPRPVVAGASIRPDQISEAEADSLLVAIKDKLRLHFRIGEDDPIYAMIEVLAEHEKSMQRLVSALTAALEEKHAAMTAVYREFKDVLQQQGIPISEEMRELSAKLEEGSTRVGMLEDIQERLIKMTEQLTHTGYMDRLIKLFAPGITGLIGVILGTAIAALFFVFLKR